MATLAREVERPAFLDAPEDGQLALGGIASPGRLGARGRREPSEAPQVDVGERSAPLSQRLRAERQEALGAAADVLAQPGLARGGAATLDELLVGAWEGLSAHHLVACPVCTAEMRPREGAAGGACGDCGSQLR